jgi:hypothetical protein
MRIRTFEGLGLGESKDVLVAKCRAWVVNVPFKKDYEKFPAEVWKAIGSHVGGRAKGCGQVSQGEQPVNSGG